MSDRNLDDLDPKFREVIEKLLTAWEALNIDAIITETWRSSDEQDKAYSGGLSNAKAGQSPHNLTIDGRPASQAIDFMLKDDDGVLIKNGTDRRYKEAGEVAEGLDLEWGGRWHKPDYDHIEMPGWRNA